jgi:hypothetical protein
MVHVLWPPDSSLHFDWCTTSPASVASRRKLECISSSRTTFSTLELAHAIIQADVARRISHWAAARRAAGFLWEWGDTISSANGNLRLDASGYVDFVMTSLVARVGQGLALLHLQDLGYTYVAHYSALCAPAGRRSPSTSPDFVLENRVGCRALLEAKASTSPSRVRGLLKRAKGQLAHGLKQCPVGRAYATVSVLRNLDDKADSAGVLVHCAGAPRAPLAADQIVVREHYAVWTKVMGLSLLASRLARPETPADVPPFQLPVTNVAGRQMAVVPLLTSLMGPWWWDERLLKLALDLLRLYRRWPWPTLGVGLDLAILRLLIDTVRTGRSIPRDDLFVGERAEREAAGGRVSIFPDGSAFGLVSPAALERSEEI